MNVRERVRRLRIVAADKAYPGGLAAHAPAASAATTAPEPVGPPPGGAYVPELAQRTLPIEQLLVHGPIQAELAELITDAELAELEPLLTPEERTFRAGYLAADPRIWSVGLALHRGVGEVAARTGLSAEMPPEQIHAMTHATWVTGGDARYADLVMESFATAGTPIEPGARVLDFGCSSGRVVRMLAARRPDHDWHGCDVNGPAIAWAREAVPAVTFHDQPLRPPLPFDDASLDAAFAISIWSHYGPGPALAWLEELRRVIRPGGALLLTTHGEAAIAVRSAEPNHGAAGQAAMLAALYRDGHAFVPFGPEGDTGVVDAEWGTAFFTPEWLATHATPHWSIRLFRPAALEGHQDVYVLRREAEQAPR